MKVDAIELPYGVVVTSTPDGCVAIFERGINATEWTEKQYPSGSHTPARGHRFARLDQSNEFESAMFGIKSKDPAIGAAGIFFNYYTWLFGLIGGKPMADDAPVHAVGGADEPFPKNYFGIDVVSLDPARPTPFLNPDGKSSSTARVHLQTQPGETVSQFAARFANQVNAALREQYGIGAQWPSLPTARTNLAITFDAERAPLPIQLNLAYNNTRIQEVKFLQQPVNILDASPLVYIVREVPGRAPKPGDNCGQFTFGYGPIGVAGLNVNWGAPQPDFQAMIRSGDRYGTAVKFAYQEGQDTWQP